MSLSGLGVVLITLFVDEITRKERAIVWWLVVQICSLHSVTKVCIETAVKARMRILLGENFVGKMA